MALFRRTHLTEEQNKVAESFSLVFLVGPLSSLIGQEWPSHSRHSNHQKKQKN